MNEISCLEDGVLSVFQLFIGTTIFLLESVFELNGNYNDLDFGKWKITEIGIVCGGVA